MSDDSLDHTIRDEIKNVIKLYNKQIQISTYTYLNGAIHIHICIDNYISIN